MEEQQQEQQGHDVAIRRSPAFHVEDDSPLTLDEQFDAAVGSRKLESLSQTTEGLKMRLRSLEKLLLGAGIRDSSPKDAPVLGGGLLGAADLPDFKIRRERRGTVVPNSMSLVARLSVQEQRFTKMSSELDTQMQTMDRMQKQIDEIINNGTTTGSTAGAVSPNRTRNFVRQINPNSSKGGRPAREGPNMMEELVAATGRRAKKRRQLGLALLD